MLILAGPLMEICVPWSAWRLPDGKPVTVLTCNVQGLAYSPSKLGELIARTHPDLIALQECSDEDHLDALAGFHTFRRGELVVASHWPLTLCDFPSNRDPQRSWPRSDLLIATAQTPFGTLHFCTVHFDTPRFGLSRALDRKTILRPARSSLIVEETVRRERESHQVAALIARLPKPVIVAGDFNMPADSNIFRDCWSGWRNAFSDAGWGDGHTVHVATSSVKFGHRIDHILSDPQLRASRSWVESEIGSDHSPLIAELRWCEQKSSNAGPNKAALNPLLNPEKYQRLVGCRYTAEPDNPSAIPQFTQIEIPAIPGGFFIWGAFGRDHRGHIWFGVSTSGGPQSPAHLFEYNPDVGQVVDRGDVITELKRCGIYRRGECQMKIHSRIVQGADGNLYFTSNDEQGQDDLGRRNPTWGSHLWRYHLSEQRWEHLLSAPEGLIALAGAGNDIFALGYFNHVLYHYDISSSSVRSVEVGSLGGHSSRNVLSDYRGHAYVPRLTLTPQDDVPRVTLVEFDGQLRELGESPLEHYLSEQAAKSAEPLCYSLGKASSVGIGAFQPMADGSLVFATSTGYLYQILPQENGPSSLRKLGWYYPQGERRIGWMFTSDGRRYVMGATQCSGHWEWLIFDLLTRRSVAVPIPKESPIYGNGAYGCVTRDDKGAFYVGGGRQYSSLPLTPALSRAVQSMGLGREAGIIGEGASAQLAEPIVFRVRVPYEER